MGYKTILVHVDGGRHAPVRMRHAAALAKRFGAHLVGSAFTGLSHYAAAPAGLAMVRLPPEEIEATRARYGGMLDRFDAICAAEGVPSAERRLRDDDYGDGLALQARYADLVVLSQIDRDDPAFACQPGGLPEQVVIDSGRPVLILPCAGELGQIGQRILLAWDGSLEAARATWGAMPMLCGAALVTICTFGTGRQFDHEPGVDLALYLARHGVACEVRQSAAPIGAGAELLAAATHLQADLIVMGCYGHSQFREIVLGGVTQTVLLDMTVPVLMTH